MDTGDVVKYIRSINLNTATVTTLVNNTTLSTIISKTRGMNDYNTNQVYGPVAYWNGAGMSSSGINSIFSQPLSPPYYFGLVSLNYSYNDVYRVDQGDVGLYLLGTKANGEVAAYYQFLL